ncbi:MAG: methylmalonyl-CoA mutase, partial [Deltaproteobacteria bacterium CG_4_9_14_3_um_filter_44_9]
LSLRTQQIIGNESGVANVIDPLGGSYCIESLTNQLEQKAVEILKELEDMQPRKAYQYIVDQGRESGYLRQKAIDNNERAMVGVNRFVVREGEEGIALGNTDILGYDPT